MSLFLSFCLFNLILSFAGKFALEGAFALCTYVIVYYVYTLFRIFFGTNVFALQGASKQLVFTVQSERQSSSKRKRCAHVVDFTSICVIDC